MSAQPIKLVFLGNVETKLKIGEYQSASISNHSDIKKVFERMCQMFNGQTDQRTKLGAPQGNSIYLTILSPNIFYLGLVDTSYPERMVFSLFDEIHIEKLYNDIDQNELSNNSKQKLREIVDKYQDQTKLGTITAIESDLSEIKKDARKNINRTLENLDDMNSLENQSSRIKMDALVYNENAKELKKVSFFQNFKWTLIVIGCILILVGVILIPILT